VIDLALDVQLQGVDVVLDRAARAAEDVEAPEADAVLPDPSGRPAAASALVTKSSTRHSRVRYTSYGHATLCSVTNDTREEHLAMTRYAFEGAVAIVTGGSRGIGAAAVRMFAGAGANRPQPLSQAPPFDAPAPGNPTNGKRRNGRSGHCGSGGD
jgi:hypothetical protein